MSFLSTAVQDVLEHGSFCAVATMTPDGPHCTPLVFASSGGRIWLTTSRRSVKARCWRTDPSAAGLIRHGDLAVTFTGTVKTYDALDRRTWGSAVAGATSIARATATFSRKNARFFAGYAFDARQVPLAWTPPGRVFVGVDLERTALLGRRGGPGGPGPVAASPARRPRSAAAARRTTPFALLPDTVVDQVGREGDGVLTVTGERGPVVLPARWRAEEHALYAAIPAESLALADAGPEAEATLTVDSPSIWRARDMVGAMIQGQAAFFVDGEVGSGAKTARTIASGLSEAARALVRIVPRRLVWWEGWTSGSARVR